MATNQTLNLWTKLLVAEHGRSRVIAALAQVEDTEFDIIEREVDEFRKKKSVRRRRRTKTLTELLEGTKFDANTLGLVKKIGFAYESKRYLPELWRVRRFLESHGVAADKVRSRAAALPLVVQVLGQIPLSELTMIAAKSNESTRGDLGIIADQILGSKDNSSKTDHDASTSPPQDPAR